MKLLLFILFSLLLFAEELVVVGNKTFPKDRLSKEEVKLLFLAKHRFMNSEKVLLLNLENNTSLRSCFEEKVLEKSKRGLERYWRKAYYQGVHPPKVVKSQKMLFAYLDEVAPSLGYCESNLTLEHNVTILFSISCEQRGYDEK